MDVNSFVNIMLYIGYALFVVAAVLALLLPLGSAMGNPKSLLKSGIGLVALVVLFGISYAIAGDEVTEVYSKFEVGPERSKWIGGSLIMTYLLFLIAVVGIFITEFGKIFK